MNEVKWIVTECEPITILCVKDGEFWATSYSWDYSYVVLPREEAMVGETGYPIESRPHISWKHIDGPLLVLRDGRLHWLTWRDRLRLWTGFITVEQLERELWYENVLLDD